MKSWPYLFFVAVLPSDLTVARAQTYQYTVTDLGSLDGSFDGGVFVTEPLAISSSGRIVGASGNAAGYSIAFTYKNGKISSLGTLPGGVSSGASAVNSAGQIAGYSNVMTGNFNRAFLFSSGIMMDLGTLPGGTTSQAAGINDSGQVVGYGDLQIPVDGEVGYPFHAILYSGGQIVDLGVLPGAGGSSDCCELPQSNAYAINSSGTVVGWSTAGSGTNAAPHAFMYSNGAMTDLSVLQSGFPGAATAINDSGQIVGYSLLSQDGSTGQHAFLYSQGTMKDIGTLGGIVSTANGINKSGVIVGYSSIASGYTHAFMYSNKPDCGSSPTNPCSPMADLNDGIDPSKAIVLTNAASINDSGEIVAWGQVGGIPTDHGYLLQPSCGPFNVSVSNHNNNGLPGVGFEFGASIYAQLMPNPGTTLLEMAAACGFEAFSWQQQIIHMVCPSGYAATPADPSALPSGTALCPANPKGYVNLSAPPAFFDPPEGGYQVRPTFNPAPFAIPMSDAFPENQANWLWYQDEPSDFCLQDPSPINTVTNPSRMAYCGSSLPEPGEYVGFITSLVGVVPGDPDTPSVPICRYIWTSSWNGSPFSLNLSSGGVPIQSNTCTSQTPAPAGLATARLADQPE